MRKKTVHVPLTLQMEEMEGESLWTTMFLKKVPCSQVYRLQN